MCLSASFIMFLMYICEPPRKYTRVCISKKKENKKKILFKTTARAYKTYSRESQSVLSTFFIFIFVKFFLFGFPRSWVIVEMLMAYSFLFSPSFSFFFFSSCCCHPTKYRNVGVCVCVSSLISPRQHFRSVPWKILSWREKKKEGRTKSISTSTQPPINGQCLSVGSWFFFFVFFYYFLRGVTYTNPRKVCNEPSPSFFSLRSCHRE